MSVAEVAPAGPMAAEGGVLPNVRPGPFSATRWWWLALLVLAASIVLLRSRYFGDPVIDPDEQFYLLVGDRMWRGALPYVDIWDRKPVGLFLIYAAIRGLGGEGIVQYQLVATAFCIATALTIAAIARLIASPRAALAVSFAYAPALAMSGGAGGQSPVFYNLPMALAAFLITRIIAGSPSRGWMLGLGAGAMSLAGLAVQIKYSAVFEGGFFAAALLVLAWRVDGRLAPRWLEGAVWLALLLLPTVLAWGWYMLNGAGEAFVFANFTSILKRGAYGHAAGDLAAIGIRLTPFIIVIAMGEWLLRPFRQLAATNQRSLVNAFVLAWLSVAVGAFLAFGTFFNHYALPLLVPLSIAAAPTLTVRFRRAGAVFAIMLLAAVYLPYPIDAARLERVQGDKALIERMTALIAPRLGRRCLFVFYGDPILYQTTRSCLPTRWPFPYHLSLTREANALGIDALQETRRIMASQPAIVVNAATDDDEIDSATQAIVRADLRAHYRLIGRFHLAYRDMLVWQWRG